MIKTRKKVKRQNRETKNTGPLTRADIRVIQNDLRAAIQAVAEKHNMQLARNSCPISYLDWSLRFRGELERENSDGVNPDAQKQWNIDCEYYGLTPDDFNSTIKTGNGRTVRITGINRRGKVYPIKAVDVNTGQPWKLSIWTVLNALNRSAPSWIR